MNLKVKICGMREPENVRDVSQLKPQFMGFIFYDGSPRFVSDEQFLLAKKNVPKSVYSVGVFVNESIEDVINTSSEYDLDYVQLHGSESAKYCRDIFKHRISIIKAFLMDESFDFSVLAEFEPFVDYFLFDTKTILHGGSGEQFDWELLKNYSSKIRFFLSGGLSASDVDKIKDLKLSQLVGIDANSRLEIAPGLKDVEKTRALIEAVTKEKIGEK